MRRASSRSAEYQKALTLSACTSMPSASMILRRSGPTPRRWRSTDSSMRRSRLVPRTRSATSVTTQCACTSTVLMRRPPTATSRRWAGCAAAYDGMLAKQAAPADAAAAASRLRRLYMRGLPVASLRRQLDQLGGVTAQDGDALLIGQAGRIEHVVDRTLHPGHRVIGPDHELARAMLGDEMAQSLAGEHQRVEIELLEILARLLLELGSLALVGENRTAVVHACRVGGQIAATVGAADLEIRELVERTLENEVGERDRGLERVTDHVAERARALDALGDAGRLWRRLRMDENERLQLLRLLPERVEPRGRDLLAFDIAADGGAHQSELLHALLELLGGKLRK